MALTFKKDSEEPVRLQKKEERQAIMIEKTIIGLGIIIGIILLLILFILICLMIVPQTHGFYWY